MGHSSGVRSTPPSSTAQPHSEPIATVVICPVADEPEPRGLFESRAHPRRYCRPWGFDLGRRHELSLAAPATPSTCHSQPRWQLSIGGARLGINPDPVASEPVTNPAAVAPTPPLPPTTRRATPPRDGAEPPHRSPSRQWFFARFGGGCQRRQRRVILPGSGLANRCGGGLGRPQCHAVDEPVAQHEGMKQDCTHVGGEGQKEQERQN